MIVNKKKNIIISIACLVGLICVVMILGWHIWLRNIDDTLPITIRKNPTNLSASDIILIRYAINQKVGTDKGSVFDLGFTDTGGKTVYAQSTIGGAVRNVIILKKEWKIWTITEIGTSLYCSDPDYMPTFPTAYDTTIVNGNVQGWAGPYMATITNDYNDSEMVCS